jgi:hypothetical protein
MNIGFILCGLLLLYDTLFCCQICFVSIRDDWCDYRQTEWYTRIRRVIPYQTIDEEGEEIEVRTYSMNGQSGEIV